jgi:hypothetical protein
MAKGPRIALGVRARLAQVQEPGRACGEAGGGNGDKLPHAFRLPHRFMGCRWRERHRALGWCRGLSSRDGDLRGRVPALAQGTNHLAPRLSSNRRQSPDSACVMSMPAILMTRSRPNTSSSAARRRGSRSPTICHMRNPRRRAKTSADRDAASGRHGHATRRVRRNGLNRLRNLLCLFQVISASGALREEKSAHGGNGEQPRGAPDATGALPIS